MIWSSYALAQVPVIDAANLTQAQQTAANTKQILATDQSHPVECAKDLAGGDRQPLLVGSRLAGANGARRRLFHGPGAVSGFGDFGRAALLRRTRRKFAKHHFDADQRASTRQKPHADRRRPSLPIQPSRTQPTRRATIVGLINSTQGTVTSAATAYTSGASSIGSSPDVKGSIDQNSQIQAQNGQSIVQLNGTVNTAAAAANQANLDRIAALSAAARAMQFKPFGQ